MPIDLPKPRVGKAIALLLGLLALAMVGHFAGSTLDTTTELTPNHDEYINYYFVAAGAGGLVAAALAVRFSKDWSLWRRAVIVLGSLLIGALAVVQVLSPVADLVEGMIDFPAGKTRTFPALLVLSRAYHNHRGARIPEGWRVQTTPVWSDLEITKADYNFMLAHQRTGDRSRNPDEISSDGYFCGRVTLQQAGDAVRVLHAGYRALPPGTVIRCPPAVTQAWSAQGAPQKWPRRVVVAWPVGPY
ncbi:MAG TPA: hypothetical protein VG407_03745 [Caulobacteraceae bacterium]|jgi:hypothetical protein|nr:hypothetical protein [Caulobacteraceae bacterium]